MVLLLKLTIPNGVRQQDYIFTLLTKYTGMKITVKLFVFIAFTCLLTRPLPAQWQQSWLQADGRIKVRTLPAPAVSQARTPVLWSQLTGYPKSFSGNAVFKNFRNVTLADINQDGRPEILVGIDDQLYAFDNGQLLWQKALEGVVIYPPSVADVDDDGDLEVVQNTAGQVTGRVYLLQDDGTDYPGWPLNFDDHLLLTAPVLSDLDGDDQMEIIVLERISPGGNVHILRLDGSSFNANWPVALPATPAVTPSVGDVDGDGELEVVVNSTEARYIFALDGQFEPGFPLTTHPRQRYSFQSPILVDLDDNDDLEIVGATHGDNVAPLPEFYVMEHNGNNFSGWPVFVPEQSWTFNTPTVVKIQDDYRIFMSRPIGTEAKDMLYGWDAQANLLPGFPIVKAGGLEGIITIGDIDGDDAMELVFGSNLIDENGFGRIHAYEMDGSGEVEGFPIEVYGWTFMNGAALDDIDGNGTMDLVALSYTQTFGQGLDTTFINAYDLGVPYAPERVLWSTYKGSNRRDGLVDAATFTSVPSLIPELFQAKLFPNPAAGQTTLDIELSQAATMRIDLLSFSGQLLRSMGRGQYSQGRHLLPLSLTGLTAGSYLIKLTIDGRSMLLLVVKK